MEQKRAASIGEPLHLRKTSYLLVFCLLLTPLSIFAGRAIGPAAPLQPLLLDRRLCLLLRLHP